jgi:thiol-disulfide isomerase/thioredoxin
MRIRIAVIVLAAAVAAFGVAVYVAGASGDEAAIHIQSFDDNAGWINSPALTPESLRGKVVLVDFWEYTCVNCLRTLPYEIAWYERYRDLGFTVVGVHTPEFQFSSEKANVESATTRLGIKWPVVLDDSYAIWKRWNNDVWPHEYLVDQKGDIVYDYEGEGDYPEMEGKIQALLRAAHPEATFPPVMDYLPQDSYEKPGAVCYPHTGELYAGDFRGGTALGNREGYKSGRVVSYVDPVRGHLDGRIYLQGPWLDSGQAMVYSTADPAADDHVAFRYHALDVVAVLKPEGGKPVTAFVKQDGEPLAKEDAGTDIRYDDSGRSYVDVDSPREYDLVRGRHFGTHDLELLPAQYGLGVYTFDFEACEVGADK